MRTSGASKRCPICGWGTIPIVYGLPAAEDFDREDIILGGCIIDELSPDLSCSNCDWSGQRWRLCAPHLPRVWIILDAAGLKAPIGLVAGRYDQIYETFKFGSWHNISFTKHYEDWLKSLSRDPRCFTSLFYELSPGLIANLRLGWLGLDWDDLPVAGFQERTLRPPKFIFDGLMDHLGN